MVQVSLPGEMVVLVTIVVATVAMVALVSLVTPTTSDTGTATVLVCPAKGQKLKPHPRPHPSLTS